MSAPASDATKKAARVAGSEARISRRKVLVGVGAGAVSIAGAAFTGKSAAAATVIRPGAGQPVADSDDEDESRAGNLDELRRKQILTVLEQTGWHQGKASEILGISPSTLYRQLKAYGLTRSRRIHEQAF